MHIGIVGAGVAGLGAAWMLEPQHRITLFEKADSVGGHAYTVRIRHHQGECAVDPGAQHVSIHSYPLFARLLRILDVPSARAPVSATVHSRKSDRSFVLTPSLRWSRLASALRPQGASWLYQMWRVIRAAEQLERRGDWTLRVDEFLAGLSLSPTFYEEILRPFLAGTYDLTYHDLGGTSARAMMWYPVHQKPRNPLLPFELTEVTGGIGAFINKLAAQLQSTELRLSTPICAVRKQGTRFSLITEGGVSQTVDALILALPAQEAARLLDDAPGLNERRQILQRFPYHPTQVAIHGDRRFMPTDRRQWSSCNYVFDDRASYITMWLGQRQGLDLFKTWITHSPTLPRDLYLNRFYRHPSMTPEYYRAQAALSAQQGRDDIWTVGSYTQGIDCQESGVASALAVASRLAPESPRVLQMQQAPWHRRVGPPSPARWDADQPAPTLPT